MEKRQLSFCLSVCLFFGYYLQNYPVLFTRIFIVKQVDLNQCWYLLLKASFTSKTRRTRSAVCLLLCTNHHSFSSNRYFCFHQMSHKVLNNKLFCLSISLSFSHLYWFSSFSKCIDFLLEILMNRQYDKELWVWVRIMRKTLLKLDQNIARKCRLYATVKAYC